MHLAPRIKKSQRELIELRAQKCMDKARNMSDGYLEYLGQEFSQSRGKEDVERRNRRELLMNKQNCFAFLVGQYAIPSKPEYRPLQDTEIERNFQLEVDPNVHPPKGRKTGRSKISMLDEQPAKKKKQTGPTPSAHDDDDEESNALKLAEQSRLEQMLQDTIDNLIANCKFSKNPFLNLGFPFNNPFAVRLERHGGVVPDQYFDVVKVPMDLSKMKDKVLSCQYKSIEEFEHDIGLIISNSRAFHQHGTDMARLTKQFETFANRTMKKVRAQLRK